MQLGKFFVLSVTLATAACARDDKKTSTNAVRINAADATLLQYEYGHYVTGFKHYELNMFDGRLDGSWNRREIVEGQGQMVNRKGGVLLSAAQLLGIKDLLGGLNDAMVSVDKTTCGTNADGPSQSLVVTLNQDPASQISVVEEDLLSSICADAYVANDSLQPLTTIFFSSLPEPEVPVANLKASEPEAMHP